MSEYAGIKAGALHEHTELSEYYCARCGYPVTDHDSYCRECGGAFQRSFATEPCDRDALLEIAVELDHPIRQAVWNQSPGVRREHVMREYARRIREALGDEEVE